MKKKMITAAILTISLFTGASTVYAGDSHGKRIGGTGDGPTVFGFVQGDGTTHVTSEPRGGLSVKLNGFLDIYGGSYDGDAFINLVQFFDQGPNNRPPLMELFKMDCIVSLVTGVKHQLDFMCDYNRPFEATLFKSTGQCYTNLDKKGAMACNFMYDIPETIFDIDDEPNSRIIAPVSFPKMF